ncbi:MAG TPA: SIR2 family protein, partial [Phycisphaerae bacterium]|nr:SIR2 family protein [Phycisphaerae bacterium]
MSYTQTIDHLVETVRKACDRGCNCSLLIGAGCSVTAGIPTADGFVKRIEKEYPKKFALADEKTYAGCMAELTAGERRSLIAEYVDAARINWAHISIACLLRNGFVDRVLTTNFDPLVVRACALLNEFPAVYDFAASSLYKGAYVPDKAVFHLHGQRAGFVLINTEEDYKRHSGLLAPVFEDAGRGRVWVVVGYSGESDPVFDHLAKTRVFDEGLYWIGYEERDAPQHVREKLLASDKSAYYVQGFDADGFFVTLARNLGVFPPDLLDKPFTHLDACLQTLTPEFTEPGQDTPTDVCRGTRDLIARAIRRFEEEVIEETEEAKREIAEARSVSELQRLMMAGDYDAVIAEYEKASGEPTGELSSLAARAHMLRGNDLLESARATQGEEADGLLVQACEKYEAALAITPDDHWALNNWGWALSDQAKTKEGAE